MTSIDQVIARSRQPGAFSERKRFTVARKRGIQKLRRFALADPHEYILELIQAAIANGARWIDISLEHERCTLSYIGGGLREAELAQLFDFLFASKDRTDIGHVRELALGLNAVLLFAPHSVVVESGDGTAAGTTRMEMYPDRDEVDVGRPDRPLTGTFVHIEGMNRRRLPKGFRSYIDLETPRERGIIEERCLAAPIPIVVNHQPLFGFSSQRVPGLFGYRNALAVDEGDLYGTIGIDPVWGTPAFQLLTWGVSIASKHHELVPDKKIGGIVCFDALHKTVDHTGIVEDDRLAELWVRLRPYAQQLVSGKASGSPYRTSRLDGKVVPPPELRRLLREHDRVVVVPPKTRRNTPWGDRAASIGLALDAPVLCAPVDQIASLRTLAGGELAVVAPDLSDDRMVEFCRTPPLSPPKGPWITSPVQVEPVEVETLARRIGEGERTGRRDDLARMLGRFGDVTATVYTPKASAHEHDGVWVWITTSDRFVWHATVPSPYPGHVLVVALPDTDPFRLTDPIDAAPEAPPLAAEVARVMVEHAVPALAEAFDRAVATLASGVVEPGSVAAGLGLAAVARSVLPRLRRRDGRAAVELTQVEATHVDLVALPILRTRAGRAVSMRDVAAAMDACCGLVYATIPSVPAATEALDADRILDLDEAGERMLVSLVGEGAYVRIDRRDVLAEFRNVMCRDLAIGLREYPDFPLLVEGADPSGWSDEDRRACTKALVVRLARRFLGLDPEAPAEVDALAQWEECRRQACRHLQWYIARLALPANTPRGPEAPDFGVADLPLFLDTSGEPRSWREVRKALDQPEGLTLVYGHALGTAELGWLAAAGQRGHRPPPNRPPPSTLYADPFVHHLLAEHPAVHPAFDFELRARGDAEGDTGPLLASELVEGPGFRGRIGVPSLAPERPDIAVVLADGRRARILTAQALVHGVVGWVRLDTDTAASDDALDAVEQAVRAAAQRALGAIVDALPGVAEPEQRQRHVTLLLDYAARHVALQMDPHGRAHTNVTGTFVARVLSLPLFASQWGGMWTGWRLLRRFCGLLQSGAADPSAVILSELAPPIPHEQHRWIERVLTPQNVVRAPAHDVTPAPPLPAPDSRGTFDHPTLCATIEYWLKRLRPDDVDPATHVWLVQRDADMLMEGAVGALYINADHWLPAWALRTGCNDPQVLAWLLLAVYADLNAALDPILNSHEHVFQRRVLDALHAGELRVVGRVE